jgi:DNA-directed RNA polymerase subunit beta'
MFKFFIVAQKSGSLLCPTSLLTSQSMVKKAKNQTLLSPCALPFAFLPFLGPQSGGSRVKKAKGKARGPLPHEVQRHEVQRHEVGARETKASLQQFVGPQQGQKARGGDLYWKMPFLKKSKNVTYFNYTFNKSRLRQIISWSLKIYGHYQTVLLLDELKRCGYEHATQAGISLGIDDLRIPVSKKNWLMSGQIRLNQSQSDVDMSTLNRLEYSAQMISTWNHINETVKNEVVFGFQKEDMLNPVFMMAFSGARGNISQVRQLSGMRGLMSDPNGEIIIYPIESNFREGLTLTEYILSCYGARKGVVDTALRTATSGYLTRRLVDVAHHVVIHELDCATRSGIHLTALMSHGKQLLSLQNRLIGRVLCLNIFDKQRLIASRNQEIDLALARQIVENSYSYRIRSPLTCESRTMVCQKCYGWSLTTQQLVPLGECVGVIAAQSIGEPGTQLTMRTFHTGGVFSGELSQELRSPASGRIRFEKIIPGTCVRTHLGQVAFCTL